MGGVKMRIGGLVGHARFYSLSPRLSAEALAKAEAGRGDFYRRVSRQPAASASSTEQNQRVPLEIFILICAYQRLVGL